MSLKELKEELLQKDLLITIHAEALGPTRVGGYNADPYSQRLGIIEGPRTQEIKGLWRWWARAAVGGAVKRRRGFYISMKTADHLVSYVLGDQQRKSRYSLVITKSGAGMRNLRELSRIPRVNLLLMGQGSRERYYHYQKGLWFELQVRGDETHAGFAVATLIASLMFSGIGSMINRGFGKLKLRFDYYVPEISDVIEAAKGVYANPQENLPEFIELVLKKAEEFLDGIDAWKTLKPENGKLPPFGILEPENFQVICLSSKDVIQILECLGKATMKAFWKIRMVDRRPCRFANARDAWRRGFKDELKKRGHLFHTWVLGLPRRSSMNEKITGYMITEEKDRRQSAIGFSIIPSGNKRAIVMYKFPASDLIPYLINSALRHHSVIRGKSLPPEPVINYNIQDPVTGSVIPKPDNVEDFYLRCLDVAFSTIRDIVKGWC